MSDEVKVVVVEAGQQEQWSDEEQAFVFKAPSNFYFIDALGNSNYIITKDRAVATKYIKDHYDGKYVVRTVRDQKTKSKSESGDISVRGSNTRKCFSPRLKGLK